MHPEKNTKETSGKIMQSLRTYLIKFGNSINHETDTVS